MGICLTSAVEGLCRRESWVIKVVTLPLGRVFVGKLTFDFKPLRMVPYAVAGDGSLSEQAGGALAGVVSEGLQQARAGQLPIDNPIMQITAWKPAGTIEHSKTDVFLQRLQFTGELGERIKAALLTNNNDQVLAQL